MSCNLNLPFGMQISLAMAIVLHFPATTAHNFPLVLGIMQRHAVVESLTTASNSTHELKRAQL